MSFKFLEDIAIADVAFEASGKNLEQLFESAALATTQVMVELKTISRDVSKPITIKAKDVDKLLRDFLDEIIFIKDSDLLVFAKFDIKIKKNGSYELKANAYGEKLDMKKHKFGVDVKATTMHMFEVKKEATGWKARVILDI